MMKTYYCPLCEEKLTIEAASSIYGGFAFCPSCSYHLFSDDIEKKVEQFLSKFPSIMRLRVRDKIKCYGKVVEVFDKDLNNNVIEVYFGGEYSRFVSPAEIEKFPWELEERGAK